MRSLHDQFCPQSHDGPITAAAYDPHSKTIATADALGEIRIRLSHGALQQLNLGAAVRGALAISQGGEKIAAGDDQGTIAVYETQTGQEIFIEKRDGSAGQSRAFRGLALNRQGTRLASISHDNILRVWDLQKKILFVRRSVGSQTIQNSCSKITSCRFFKRSRNDIQNTCSMFTLSLVFKT